MSRRDYIAAAEIFRDVAMPDETRAELVARFSDMFATDNPRFSPSRFREACKPRFAVVENTPGYLPEDVDPAEFSTFAEAEEYAAALADGYRDTLGLTRDDGSVSVSRESRTLWRVENPRNPHDLGRVVEILGQ